MTTIAIRERLILVARDRLTNRPGAFEQFQHTLDNTVQGVAMTTAAQAVPYVWGVAEQMGNTGATERIQNHLLGIVDRWAESQTSISAVEPLPGTAPARGQARTSKRDTAAHRTKRTTWWDVSSEYISGVIRAGQYGTAKELFRALEAKAGPNSPFDKGEAANRGSLFVREIMQPLTLKTIQNRFPELCELARK